jgi:hypothetical protein
MKSEKVTKKTGSQHCFSNALFVALVRRNGRSKVFDFLSFGFCVFALSIFFRRKKANKKAHAQS